MINLISNKLIYRPIRQIFEFISTPENDFQWQYGTLKSAQVSEGGIGVGTFFRSIGHFMGHRIQGTYEVTDYEPNEKYGFKSLSGPLHSQTLYTFELVGGGTKVNISTQATAVNLFQSDEGILEKKMKKQLKENLTLLKDILEQSKHIEGESKPILQLS
ncbi:MAG TPA: SRPBCC family protein [Anaerolineales bacterium]